MSGSTWSKFYWSDWRSDPALRACSLAARGLWMEMLGIMNESTPRGQLLIAGRPPSVELLASLCGSTFDEVAKLMAELEANRVFSRKRNGIIFSRRIERDEIKSRKNRDNGKLGGNPNIRKITEKQQSVNPTVNPEDKPQRPEARYQKLEREEETPRILQQRELVDEPAHRALISELRNRGHGVLTDFEKTFLGSIFGLKTLTRKQRETFDAVRLKVDELAKSSGPSEWETKLKWARQNKQWPQKWGALPFQNGCQVPPHLLRSGDGQGWTEWKAAS